MDNEWQPWTLEEKMCKMCIDFFLYKRLILMTLVKEDYSVGQVQSSLRSSIKIHTFTIYIHRNIQMLGNI